MASVKLVQIEDITRTILAISSPVNTQTIVSNSPTVSVTGTTAGNISVATVWLNVNGGSWVPAVSTTGYSNWTAAVPAPAGADTLQAYAVDTAGNLYVADGINALIRRIDASGVCHSDETIRRHSSTRRSPPFPPASTLAEATRPPRRTLTAMGVAPLRQTFRLLHPAPTLTPAGVPAPCKQG